MADTDKVDEAKLAALSKRVLATPPKPMKTKPPKRTSGKGRARVGKSRS